MDAAQQRFILTSCAMLQCSFPLVNFFCFYINLEKSYDHNSSEDEINNHFAATGFKPFLIDCDSKYSNTVPLTAYVRPNKEKFNYRIQLI
jgi:hypothetical protein